MSDVTKRLVLAIVRFLGSQLQQDNLTADAKESLEVAIQCLETAYSVSLNASMPVDEPQLLEIFSNATRNYNFVTDESCQQQQQPSKEIQEQAEALKNQGNNLMKLEKLQEAIACYSKAIELDKNNAIYHCNRAAAYSKLNDHRSAIADCEAAVTIDPTYSKAFGRMGLAYASLGDQKRAKDCYEQALRLDPTNESYINNLKVAEEKLVEQTRGADPFGQGMPPRPGGGGAMDFNSLFSNPALVNMATQLMQDSSMRNMISGLMSNTMSQSTAAAPAQAPGGMDALLQAGQQLAAQMQASNPDLVDQLRRQMNLQTPGGDANPTDPQPPPPRDEN